MSASKLKFAHVEQAARPVALSDKIKSTFNYEWWYGFKLFCFVVAPVKNPKSGTAFLISWQNFTAHLFN